MCNNCTHRPVCAKFTATGGEIIRCRYRKEERRGRWRWGKNSMNQYGAWCTECECGWEDKGNDFDRVQGLVIAHKYCPNCGADMRGAEDG